MSLNIVLYIFIIDGTHVPPVIHFPTVFLRENERASSDAMKAIRIQISGSTAELVAHDKSLISL